MLSEDSVTRFKVNRSFNVKQQSFYFEIEQSQEALQLISNCGCIYQEK